MINGEFQILLNYLTVFVIPALVGVVLSLILGKAKKLWLAPAVLLGITAFFGILVLTVNTNGNETFGLLTLSSATATVSACVCSVIIWFVKKRTGAKR